MLIMVIERFKEGAQAVGERFQSRGRMLPPGVVYIDSWIDDANGRCFQLMEAPVLEALQPWIEAWADLVDFDIIPVETSKDFWAKVGI